MISVIEGCCSKILNQWFLSWFLCSLIERCCSKVLNHGFLSWFPWSSDAAVRYWTKGFYHDVLDRGMLQYDTEPRICIMISLMEGCCSKVLNQGFLSWFAWSRVVAVRYWTKSFYHDFFVPWSREAAVKYWTNGFYHHFRDRGMLQ